MNIVTSLLLLCGLAAGGEVVLRWHDAPLPTEAVKWISFDAIGSPPYSRPLLLDFSADWCVPCVRMAMTTFRDPEFAELIRRLDLEPVRLSYTSENPIRFEQLLAEFGVSSIPALVVVTKDGRTLPAVTGEMNTADIEYRISQSARRAQKGIYWSAPNSKLLDTPPRPVIRSFDKWFLVDASLPRDWRWSTKKNFVTWANQNFEFVDDAFSSRVNGASYYKQFGIHALPTLIVSLPGVGQIARFEGPDEVQGAPQKIVEILAQRGIKMEAPPAER